MFCDKLDGYRDHGLLLLRVGIGAMFIAHGWGKVFGGAEVWAKLGSGMSSLGVGFLPAEFWGFMAAISEFGGGILLILGLLFRPACLMLLMTMIVAALMHLVVWDDPFQKAAHAIEAGILFLSLMLIGPGRFSLGRNCGQEASK